MPRAPIVGTPEPDHSGFGTRQQMREEIVALRAELAMHGTSGPLVAAVERLTAAGYVVLTAEQGEEAATLLGMLAFKSFPPVAKELPERAMTLLQSWPEAQSGL